ncbi:signal peptide peptidase SppA [Cellvibrio sp. OA-2007]|uniref:signal peptide peptidase SppA n=1 Tax=Cellvibrio sp. OA-2007 TaxID=529823 RepID=UPI000AB774F8|nr:signal peptide peptidase SppA [Cellvibrio sp. OA-2007]
MSVNYYEPPAAPNSAQPSPAQPKPAAPQLPAPKKRSAWSIFFGGLGAGITWFRNALMNTLFIVFLIIFIVAIGSSAPKPLPDTFALRLAPTGLLVDQRSYIDPTSLLLSDEDPEENETLVSDIVEAINKAAKDKRVNLLVLEPGRLLGGGISKMDEIGQALENFKSAGKKIIAVSDNYSQDQYYLASFANEIYLHEMGMIEITGYSRYMNYYKTALDKLGVTIHAFRSGKYKDYLEPYLRDDMSAESREHNAQWINELWGNYTGKIENRRKLPPGSINDYVNNIDAHMALTTGNSAQLALEKALVDKVVSRQDMEKMLVEQAGKSDDGYWYNGVGVKSYLADIRKHPTLDKNKVAVIVASGSIVDGYQPDGSIGSESMLELLRQVRDDKSIKALVIRIDSGGGSAFASEIIRSEIIALREKKIPIYISMGTVAASGGYWIATAGDKIWAQPTTITGSIGVFGAFPTLEKSLQKIGINTDGVGTTELAGTMRLDRPLSEKASKVVQMGVDHIYQRFITLVADARKQEVSAIDEIAQGHVWTGNKAKEIGLVDELGTLKDVIVAIAQTANLSSYQVEFVQRPLSPKEELLRSLTGGQAGKLAPTSLLEKFTSLNVLNNLAPTLKPLSDLQRMNDPQGIYVQCLDCVAP